MDYHLEWALVVGAVIGGVAHVPVVAQHVREAPYMGEEFIVPILLIAVASSVCDSAAVYTLAVLTCGWPSSAMP